MTKKRAAEPKKHASTARNPPRDSLTKALKADFDAAHEAGKWALKHHDLEGVSRAIERERQIIDQQKARFEKERNLIKRGKPRLQRRAAQEEGEK